MVLWMEIPLSEGVWVLICWGVRRFSWCHLASEVGCTRSVLGRRHARGGHGREGCGGGYNRPLAVVCVAVAPREPFAAAVSARLDLK